MTPLRLKLANGGIYHIVLRAVGDTIIFKGENEYYRGIFSLYEFNNTNPVEIWRRRRDRIAEKKSAGGLISHTREVPVRNKFVEVMAFTFMPNHIHLILRQLKDNGISKFMQKAGTEYATYFNKKYKRKGHLFGKFHSVLIKSDEQLQTAFIYVHTSAAALINPNFKENGIKYPKKTVKFLTNFKWQSYATYLGRKNFQTVTEKDFLLQLMGGEAGCRKAISG